MKLSLSNKLIGILAIGLFLAFLSQIGTRYLFEIPNLRTLEAQSDTKDIEQVRLAIFRLQQSLMLATSDHAALDESFEFIQSKQNDPVFGKNVAANLDQNFFNTISKDLQTEVSFYPIAEIAENTRQMFLLNKLRESGSWQLPRDDNEKLHWVLHDNENKPIILIEQNASKRGFSQAVISHSVVVGFACSALILTILVLYFSRTVVTRLLQARKLMLEIINTGDYGRRLPVGKNDELDSMFSQFNKLLEYIQKQNRELLEQNKTLAELSEQDALTGISNRRYLDDVLDRTWRQCTRSGKMMSVLMIDVDYFKLYNDTYGHPAGDKVLIQIAQTLQHNLHRATDYLARYGGEEFCVVLTDTNNSAAVSVAERLRLEIQNLHVQSDVSKCADVVTVSIGVATFMPDAKVHDINMVKAADEALYEAKALGRNCVYLKGGMSESGLMNIKRN